jgi:hypothetical protein
MGENLHLHPHLTGVKPAGAPDPQIQLIAIPNDGGLNPPMKEIGWGKAKAEGPTTIKGEEGRRGGRESLWLPAAATGDRRFRNEDDEEKWKLTWLLCMYREFI